MKVVRLTTCSGHLKAAVDVTGEEDFTACVTSVPKVRPLTQRHQLPPVEGANIGNLHAMKLARRPTAAPCEGLFSCSLLICHSCCELCHVLELYMLKAARSRKDHQGGDEADVMQVSF